MTEVYVAGKRIRLDPSLAIGKGGEADIYDIGGGVAVKVFKTPDHPDLIGLPHEQKGAEARILIHQKKLRAFPKGLPQRVVTPIELATNRTGQKIVGYTMRLVSHAELLMRYSDRRFREAGVSNEKVVDIFKDLHETVGGLHKQNVVIGDFNDLNVLVSGIEAYLIDADSFQFGGFMCQVFTNRFADPTLCDPRLSSLMLAKPHNENSDWYAFSVMLMQSLLFVDPYGGVYRPKNSANRIPHGARPLRRITVFHPEVIYPRPATPYGVLPDDLLQRFHQIFEKDKREPFPISLLENMRWTKCLKCGTNHARALCPECQEKAPAAVREVTIKRGKVTATRIFKTSGLILNADVQNGKLVWVYHENGAFRREDQAVVASGNLDPQTRFRVSGTGTLIAKGNDLLVFGRSKDPQRIMVDTYGSLPIFDSNENHYYWAHQGSLFRDGAIGSERIGNILSGQTLFWVGPKFGFGFYRAGEMSIAFVFDAERRGIKDTVKIPRIRGQLIDSTCVFTSERVWFFISTREGGKTLNQCSVVLSSGEIEATAEAEAGSDSWLGSIRGKCANGKILLAPTDEGVVRLEVRDGKIEESAKFPDTQDFVDAGTYLFVNKEGLFAVDAKSITQLKIG